MRMVLHIEALKHFTLNRGATWQSFNDGLTNLDVRALAIAAGNPKILYAGTSGGVFAISFAF